MLLHKASLFHVSNRCIDLRLSLMYFANMIQRVMLSNMISVGPNDDEALAQACLRALFLTDINADRANLKTTKGPRVDGTCEWIKSHELYKSWLRSNSQLLWLSGGPGKGKTMLSIFLAEELEQTARLSQNKLFLQYFCDNKDEKRNSAVTVIKGLIYQLLQSRRKLFDHILPTFRTQKESLFSFETLWRIFESMVCDPALENTYCVLDGVDECDEASLEILLGKFVALLSAKTDESSACHLNVLIVSRAVPDFIPELLSSFPRIALDPDADTEINQDIDLFIKAKVNGLSRSRRYPETLRVHVRDVFRDRAQGTFLWIGIVAQALRKYKATEVEKALELFPKGLDELYARILLQIDSGRREIAARILRWVVMAVRPLRLLELSIAIETTVGPSIAGFTRKEMMRDQVSHCGYFLVIKEDEVGLIHQSAKDYLLRKTYDPNPELEFFRVKEEAANLEIARTCLNYLHSGALENCESDILENPGHLRAFPLLNYAVLHWHEHARFLPRSEDIFDLSLPFYRKKSHIRRSWLKAYCDHKGVYKYSFSLESFHVFNLASYLGIIPLAENHILGEGWMNKTKRLYYLHKHNDHGRTALISAAEQGHEAMVRLLLGQGAGLNATGHGHYSWTALMRAAKYGHEVVVRLLLQKGADVNAKDKYGETALVYAAISGQEAVIRLLLEKGADINAKNKKGKTALIKAIDWRSGEAVVPLLLEKGTDINAKDKHGETALTSAIGWRKGDAVLRLLLEKGADVHAKNQDGETALMKAAGYFWGQLKEVVWLLFEKGADIKTQDNNEETARMEAAAQRSRTMVQLLLAKGANINAQDKRGETVLMKLVRRKISTPGWPRRVHGPIVRLLLEEGADVKAQDKRGETALMKAVRNGYEELVELVELLTSAANS